MTTAPEQIAAAKARADAAPLTAKILALPAPFPYQYDEQAMLTHAQTMEADRATLLRALKALAARIDDASGSPSFSAPEHDALEALIALIERPS